MQNVHRVYRRLGFGGALVIGLLGAHRGAAAAPVPDRAWGTYVGGVGDDYVSDLAVDSAGNVYVAGRTTSPDGIATVGAFRTTPSAFDAFLIKYDPAGIRVWGTYFGGGLDDGISGIAATDDRVVIVGYTDSDDGIATPGAHQSNKGKYGDGFIATFSVDGALVWSTYLGGGDDDGVHAAAFAAGGDLIVGGGTGSLDGIATPGAFQTVLAGYGDMFLARFSPEGARLWGTYVGGSASEGTQGVAVGPGDTIFLTGVTASPGLATPGADQQKFAGEEDMVLARFDAGGARLWSTYFGGKGHEWSAGVVVTQGGVVLAGESTSSGLATPGAPQELLAGVQDAVIARYSLDGARLWATYFGPGTESTRGMAVDAAGMIYLAGITSSASGIASSGAWQSELPGDYSAFITRFDAVGVPTWSTYYGGLGITGANAVAPVGQRIFVAGATNSKTQIASPGADDETYSGFYEGFLAVFTQPELGTPCFGPDECGGHCVDGVCCDLACGDSDPSDCQVCSIAAGALVDGVCTILGAPVICRPAVGACDVAETCDGRASVCPRDQGVGDGAPCEGGTCQAGVCEPDMGTSTTETSTSSESDTTGSASSTGSTTTDSTEGATSATATSGATSGGEVEPTGGCACAAKGTSTSGGLFFLVGLVVMARRSRRQ